MKNNIEINKKENYKKINLVDLIKEFDFENKLSDKNFMPIGENDLKKSESLLIDYTNFILTELGIFTERRAHFCDGGTCTHGKCPDLGKYTTCDSGCMYNGA